MSEFRFSYRVKSRGNAEASVSANGHEEDISPTFITDPLRDLARELIVMLKNPGVERVSCEWVYEPGQYRWIVTRRADRVLIRILLVGFTYSHHEDDECESIFEAECSLLRLATQVKGQMHQVLNDLGQDEYRKLWGGDFPMSEFLQLTQLIQDRKHSAVSGRINGV